MYIPVVNKFCYLGSWITRDGTDDLDVDTCIEKAGAAFCSSKKISFWVTEDIKERQEACIQPAGATNPSVWI